MDNPKISPPVRESSPTNSPSVSRLPARRPVVMVVDNHVLLGQMFGNYLTVSGYRTFTSTNFGGAVALLNSGSLPKVDLLVADTDLPDGGASDLALAFLQSNPFGRILFVGSNPCIMPSDCQALFLRKPFCLSLLGEKVQEILQSPPFESGLRRS